MSKKKNLTIEKTSGQEKKNIIIISVIVGLILVVIDQFTKELVINTYKVGQGKAVIKDVFEIQHIKNKGSAWGMFHNIPVIPIVISLIMILLIMYVYSSLLKYKRYRSLRICVVFLLAGAVANIIDRIRLGSVTDFLYFKLINFPVFNVADIYVTFSVAVVIILLIFKFEMGDIDVMLGSSFINDEGKIVEKSESKKEEK